MAAPQAPANRHCLILLHDYAQLNSSCKSLFRHPHNAHTNRFAPGKPLYRHRGTPLSRCSGVRAYRWPENGSVELTRLARFWPSPSVRPPGTGPDGTPALGP